MGIGVPFAGVSATYGVPAAAKTTIPRMPRGSTEYHITTHGEGGGLPAASGTGLTGTPAPLCLLPAGSEGKEDPGGKGEWQGQRHQWKGITISTSCWSRLCYTMPFSEDKLLFQENDENGEPEVDDEDDDEVDEEDEEDDGDGG